MRDVHTEILDAVGNRKGDEFFSIEPFSPDEYQLLKQNCKERGTEHTADITQMAFKESMLLILVGDLIIEFGLVSVLLHIFEPEKHDNRIKINGMYTISNNPLEDNQDTLLPFDELTKA